MTQYSLLTAKDAFSDPKLSDQINSQFEQYRLESGGIAILPNSHFFIAKKNDKLIGWILGHPAIMGKVFEGEKAFVPVAVFVVPSQRKSFSHKNFFLGLISSLKKQNFDFLHLQPDMPFMLTKKGKKISEIYLNILKRRGLKENEGSIRNKNIFCLNADKAERKFLEKQERLKQLEQQRAMQKPKKRFFERLFRRKK